MVRISWLFLLGTLLLPDLQAQTLRVATLAPDGSSWMREMRAAADAIEQASAGRVKLQYYPGGVMGSDATVLRRMRAGQLQGGAFASSELSAVYNGAQVYGLPFLFREQAEIDHVRTHLDQRLRDGFADKGMVLAGISGGGFVYLMGNRPLTRIEDLRSGKVWVPQGDRISETTFRAGGINPVALSIGDVLTGLQTGLVDVVGNTPSGALAFQWHTRVEHVFDLPLAYVVGYLAFDARAFGRLSQADQSLVREQIGAAFVRLDDINLRDNAAALQTLQRQGLKFAAPDETEAARWRDVGARATAQLLERGDVDRGLYNELATLLTGFREQQASAPSEQLETQAAGGAHTQ